MITRGIERRVIFVDDIDRADFLSRLQRLAESGAMTVLAWALMPNHVHLLSRTLARPLSWAMRSLITGYAVHFNRRHQRAGYVFQNRFKSILVEEEPYLLELVRYVHLNPVRSGILAGVDQLDRYPWTGHASLLGKVERPWQGTREVLALFGQGVEEARRSYRRFIRAAADQGEQPELVGKGLRQKRGEWSSRREQQVRGRDLWSFDERILGSVDFVRRVLGDKEIGPLMAADREAANHDLLPGLMREAARLCRTSPEEIASSSRRRPAVDARAVLCRMAVVHLGMSSNGVARFLGVTRQSVRRGLERAEEVFTAHGLDPAWMMSASTAIQAERGAEFEPEG